MLESRKPKMFLEWLETMNLDKKDKVCGIKKMMRILIFFMVF